MTDNPEIPVVEKPAEVRQPEMNADLDSVVLSYEDSQKDNVGNRGEGGDKQSQEGKKELEDIYLKGDADNIKPENNIAALSMVSAARSYEIQKVENNGLQSKEREAADSMFFETFRRVFGEVSQPQINAETFNGFVDVYERDSTALSEVSVTSIPKVSQEDMDKDPAVILELAKKLRTQLPDRIDSVVYDKLYSKEAGADEIPDQEKELREKKLAEAFRAIYELELFIKGLEEKTKTQDNQDRANKDANEANDIRKKLGLPEKEVDSVE